MSELDYSYLPPEEEEKQEEIFDNKYTYMEVWPPMGKKETPKDLVLDYALIGMAVLGLRAVLEPSKYDSEHWLVKRGIDTAKGMGYITNEGITAPADIMDIAYPNPQVKFNQ